MKVALVYPNSEKCVNQGPGCIASAVFQAGHDLDFYDLVYVTEEYAVERVVAGNYDVVMLSASTLFYAQAARIAASIKTAVGVPILLGGLHATVMKGELLNECPNIDYLCVGEGEEFVVEFLDELNDGDITYVRNLAYRDEDGKAVVNPVRPCASLDSLPPFRYGLFRPDSIVQPYPKPGFCYVYATRGCPYNCAYCANSCYLDLYGRNFLRTRNVDAVIEELLWLKETYPVEIFYFGDEMILFNKDYCTRLFTRIHDEVELPYGCMVRVEKVTPEVATMMGETGCRYVSMGVECSDEALRKTMNRHMSNQQITEAFGLMRAIPGLTITAFSMKGWPVPNDAELTRKTKEFVDRLRPDIHQVSTFFPFPGTRLYDYCVKHDLIDWGKWRGVTDVKSYFAVSTLKPIPQSGAFDET